ncbi:MAG: hypothetical protein ACREEU_04085 [Acetobacteraceae bacterium]
MRATRYFLEQVLRKRAYIVSEWCEAVVQAPPHREARPDGRIRFWGTVLDPRDGKTRYLRVVTLDDGETIHDAFFDRDFDGGPS